MIDKVLRNNLEYNYIFPNVLAVLRNSTALGKYEFAQETRSVLIRSIFMIWRSRFRNPFFSSLKKK